VGPRVRIRLPPARSRLRTRSRFNVNLRFPLFDYGNIGAADRLDFSVIGPAVNLVKKRYAFTQATGMVNDHLVGSFATRGKKGVRSMKNTEEIWSLVDAKGRPFTQLSDWVWGMPERPQEPQKMKPIRKPGYAIDD
jgi:hypothetical protein